MAQQCKRFIVSGTVQGVGFRYHTSYQGMTLGLVGYAKNLNNGDVEVAVCGEEEAIEQMASWLTHGPKTSHVESMISEPLTYRDFKGFEIL